MTPCRRRCCLTGRGRSQQPGAGLGSGARPAAGARHWAGQLRHSLPRPLPRTACRRQSAPCRPHSAVWLQAAHATVRGWSYRRVGLTESGRLPGLRRCRGAAVPQAGRAGVGAGVPGAAAGGQGGRGAGLGAWRPASTAACAIPASWLLSSTPQSWCRWPPRCSFPPRTGSPPTGGDDAPMPPVITLIVECVRNLRPAALAPLQ